MGGSMSPHHSFCETMGDAMGCGVSTHTEGVEDPALQHSTTSKQDWLVLAPPLALLLLFLWL